MTRRWPTATVATTGGAKGPPQSTGAAYLAQTYIYGMTNNVPQVYWYGWDDHVLGVDVTNATTGEALQPGIAYNTVLNWMSKAKNGGCVYGRGGDHVRHQAEGRQAVHRLPPHQGEKDVHRTQEVEGQKKSAPCRTAARSSRRTVV